MEYTLEKSQKQVILPAGKYIIGDPCYTIPDEEWDKVLDQSGFFNDQCWAMFRAPNGEQAPVVAFSTAWGDGTYDDGAGRSYGVDAGLIGIIPAGPFGNARPFCTHVVEFHSPVNCSEKQGVICFGNVRINTDYDVNDISDDDDY